MSKPTQYRNGEPHTSDRRMFLRAFAALLMVFSLTASGCQGFSDLFDLRIFAEDRENEIIDSTSDLDVGESSETPTEPSAGDSTDVTVATPGPTATAAPVPTSAPITTSAPTSTPTLTPTPTRQPTPTLSPTPTRRPTPTLSPTPTVTPTPMPVPTTGTYQTSMADAVITLVNEERAAEGLDPLTKNSSLTSSANVRSPEIVVCWNIQHTRPDGTPWYTAPPGAQMAENMAKGQTSAASVVSAWMNSDGHRKNIMSPGYTKIGVSCYLYEGVYYWVQHFA
ncbi:MAG: CAP domain-containing protein [Clostridiaceae bacterium]|nr:CAP domain-containing protein [Clostridiaceae bacterium]